MSKTHVIDGITYVEVKREAEVGDNVWLVNLKCHTKLTEMNDIDGINEDINYGDIKVLEPLEADPQITDLIANLARRVHSLEQQLSDTQANVEKLAEELANTKYRVSKHATMFGYVEDEFVRLTDDILTLDERSQVLNAINKFYEEGSR
jgi:chromosome segregation ATPase